MSKYFPSVEEADEYGIVSVGGALTPERIADAYTHGIFPWPDSDDFPMLWFSPDPRAILPLESAHFSRRLMRTIHSQGWFFSIDKAFEAVIHGCAAPRPKEPYTWITHKMIRAYCNLHKGGIAHSVEVWRFKPDCLSRTAVNEENLELIGGIYGLAFNRFFSGESMFHTQTDASKAALWYLVETLKANGFLLFDLQVINSHTKQFGTIEIPRAEYLRRLEIALNTP